MTRPANTQPNATGLFTRRDAQRIANAVVAHEKGARREKGVSFPRNYPAGGRVRVCKTTAKWDHGSTQELEVLGEDGTATDEKVKAKNRIAPIKSGVTVLVARGPGEEWELVAFDLTALEGYTQGKTILLGCDGGELKWIETEACST